MKTKVAFLTLLSMAASVCAMAQSTEELDDMYFTSKDRATLNASRKVALSYESAQRVTESETASVINPTDSYSARNVNPEYVAGSKTSGSSATVASFFSPNYMPVSVNQRLVNNCGSCGNSAYTNYNSSYYPYNNYGYGMNPYNSFGMMNPYYGYGYGNGFYQSGLSFGFGNFYGNGFGSPFYNNYYGNYYGMGSFYNGWGNSFYGPYGGYSHYPTVVVINESRPAARPTWGETNAAYYQSRQSSSNPNTGAQYYDRSWRQNVSSTTPDRGSWGNNTGNPNGRQNTWTNPNSSWGNDGGFRNTTMGNGGGNRGGGFGGGGSGSSGGRRGRD